MTTDPNQAKMSAVMARIKKLLALSQSPNENEAASAAAAATRLMAEHDLEEAQLELDAPESLTPDVLEEVVMDGGTIKRVTWRNHVLHGLMKMNNVKGFYLNSPAGLLWKLFGRKGQVRTVIYTYQYLGNEVERLSDEAWAAACIGGKGQTVWVNSFRLGCGSRLNKRLCDMADQNTAEIEKAIAAGGPMSKAMAVVHKKDLAVADAFKEHLRKNGIQLGRGEADHSRRDDGAFASGQAAGDRVTLGGERKRLSA